MGKFAGLLAFMGLWLLVAAVRSEAISTGKPRSDSMYIVHMDKSATASNQDVSVCSDIYSSVLRNLRKEANTFSEDDSSTAQPVHVYQHAFHGFSALLTNEEVDVLRKMKGVLGVHNDTVRQVQTTRTPEFLGLSDSKGLWPETHSGEDVIVGLLDTGVWPESPSFRDDGLGPVPARWRGICEAGKDFHDSHCNKKLIGARYYASGYEKFIGGPLNETIESRSPRDTEGHGSHTSSTAAGAAVANASLLGFAEGTARGMATKARIAMYKICWELGCMDSDIAAGLDQAVADGVDVISLSLASGQLRFFYEDTIAIGTFGAIMKGIFVACAAGNEGPLPATLANVAPWVTTVAASTLDRKFPASVYLGNGAAVAGVSLYRYSGNAEDERVHGLVYGGDVGFKNVTHTDGSFCLEGTLNPALVKGKVVVCMLGNIGATLKGAVVKEAGGVGMVLVNDAATGESLQSEAYYLPATMVGAKGGALILQYIKSTKGPVAKLKFGHHSGTLVGVKHSPAVAAFSSRGPSPLAVTHLKPDITAPGVNILAAWTGRIGPSGLPSDTRRVPFNIMSGTSMATPHVGGLGALLKGAHPHWSPAAIKSALMTTATLKDNSNGTITDEATGKPGNPMIFGAGHVQPERAMDPGLVYDMGTEDYVHFMCANWYTFYQIKMFTGEGFECLGDVIYRIEDMNYPSFSAVFASSESDEVAPKITFKRTVTNVGHAKATYKATIVSPANVSISVHPKELSFSAVNEKKDFTLTVTASKGLFAVGAAPDDAVMEFGTIQWSDGKHVVQSPIVVFVYY